MDLVDDLLYYTNWKKNIIRFLGGGLLIDTGPLYLLIVGRYDKVNGTRLLSHRSYSTEDFDALEYLFTSYLKCNKLIITPHIFTEFMSHLWKDTNDKKIIPKILKQDINFLDSVTEKEISKDIIRSHKYVTELEIGDLSLYIAWENYKISAILSDDAKFLSKFPEDNSILITHFRKFKNFIGTLPKEWN